MTGGWPQLLGLEDLPTQVLVLAPHADDEVLGCGGALAHHTARGDAVRVLVLTASEGDPRLAESRAAAKALGGYSVGGLGFPDGGLDTAHGLAAQLEAALEGIQLLYVPAPSESHPDHLTTCLAAASVAAHRADLRVLAFGVNRAPAADRLLDVTPVADRKDSALACFVSQGQALPERGRLADQAAAADVDLEEVTRVESYLDLEGPAFARYVRESMAARQHAQDARTQEPRPTVTAVISTWNKAADVCANLDGLRAQTRPFDEVVVVDNASSDDTAERVRRDYPEVRLVVMPHDRYGACETFNVGFHTATSEFIAILDDDVVLTPAWLQSTLGRMQAEPDSTAIVSTKIVEPGMPASYLSAPTINQERYMSTFRGCASLARRRSVLEAGGYDERLFIYGNERDLTCRLLLNGERVLQFPGAEAFHRTPFGLQMGKRSLYYHARNAWLSMLKYAPIGDLVRMPYLVLTRVLLRGSRAEAEGAVTDAVGTIGLGRSLKETPGAWRILLKAAGSVLWNVPYCLRRRRPVRHPDFELPLR